MLPRVATKLNQTDQAIIKQKRVLKIVGLQKNLHLKNLGKKLDNNLLIKAQKWWKIKLDKKNTNIQWTLKSSSPKNH